MARPTRKLVPGALAARLAELGLSHEEAAARCRAIVPRCRVTRQTIWEAATERSGQVTDATATALLWALDARPSDLFVMPSTAPDGMAQTPLREPNP